MKMQQQKGMSLVGFLVVLAMVVFVAYLMFLAIHTAAKVYKIRDNQISWRFLCCCLEYLRGGCQVTNGDSTEEEQVRTGRRSGAVELLADHLIRHRKQVVQFHKTVRR